MAKADLPNTTSTFGSKAFDIREARNAGTGSVTVPSTKWQSRDELRNHRYNPRAQQVNQTRARAEAGGGKNTTPQSCSTTKKDRMQNTSPTFLGVHRNYRARAEAMAIGIALGSPCDNPLPPLPVEAVVNRTTTSSSASDSSMTSSIESNKRGAYMEPAKSRARRWHTLGSIFSKKTPQSQSSPNLPDMRMPSTPLRNLQQNREPPQNQAGPPFRSYSPQRTRSAGDTDGLRAGGPHVRNVPTRESKGLRMPDFARAISASLAQSEPVSPTPPPKDTTYTGFAPMALRRQTDKPPRLHVEIPNVEMERYSVMFGSCLDKTQPLSLLARRHGQLGRLASVAEGQRMVRTSIASNTTYKKLTLLPQVDSYDPCAELSRPARRATSPTMKSPSFSLFPSTSSCSTNCTTKAQRYRPSPLQRAATASGTLSPDRAVFGFSQAELQGDTTTNLCSPETASASPRGPKWSWSTSHLSHVSSESSLDERDLAPRDSLEQVPPTNIPRSTFSDKALPMHPDIVDNEDASSNAPRPHIAAPPTRATSDKARNAAEVLIARQVSISAQQRRLLSNPMPQTARQPMYPVLVDVRNGLVARNSHHVLLEET